MRYRYEKVEITSREPRLASWTFGREAVAGTEYPYRVIDGNLARQNQWEFVVRVPKDVRGRIEVRPTRVPDVKIWAGLDRRGLTFMPGTRRGYTGYRYCQVSLPGDDGRASRHVMRRADIDRLPYWIRDLRPRRLRDKATVTTTRGRDGDTLVALVPRDDQRAMILMYLATKAWVLRAGKAVAVK